MSRVVAALLTVMGIAGLHAAEDDGVWLIEGNVGADSALRLVIADDGSARASLAGRTFAGAATGQRLTLIGDTPEGPEVWIAWFGEREGGPAHLSGVIHRSDGSSTGWYAIRKATLVPAAAPPSSPPPLAPSLPNPEPPPDRPSSQTEPSQGDFAPAERDPPPAKPEDTSLEGRWQGPFGTFTIVRDGSRLTVTGSDGATANGRITGPETLVVGLRPGCCKGAMTMPGMIVWQDDTVWRRVEE
jgi:hypothetical protein